MALRLESIEYVHDGAPVLAGVDLEVADGEAVAVLGPSRPAKAALLAMAGLLVRPASGTVAIDGAPLEAGTPEAEVVRHYAIAWISQAAGLSLDRAVLDNVAAPLLVDGFPADVAVEPSLDALSSVGLRWAAHLPAASLAPGERRRVAVARALVRRPRLVLAHDPTGGLDGPSAVVVVTRLLHDLEARRTSALVVTEDAAVASTCHRVHELRDGRLAAVR